MSHKPKVSVAIIVHNHERFIADTLKSVLEQKTNFPFELVIGDDCSTDATRSIIKNITKGSIHKTVLLFHEQKVGATNNCIRIYKECSGEYIAHLDGDDMMLPGKLQKQVDFLDAHPECAISGHPVEVIDAHSKKVGIRSYKAGIYDMNYMVQHGCLIFHSSKMFRKSAIPLPSFDCSSKRMGDFLWHLQNLQCGTLVYLNETLGKYRRHPQGISYGNGLVENIVDVHNDQLYAINWAQNHGASKESTESGKSRIYFHTAIAYLRCKKYEEFIQYLEKGHAYAQGFLIGKFVWFFRKRPAFLFTILSFYLRYIRNVT